MATSFTILLLLLAGCTTLSGAPPDTASARQHADAVFQKLPQGDEKRPQPGREAGGLAVPVVPMPEAKAPQSREQYLVATGYGDLSKGATICQRVADTAARAELAKLIRVQIKEHATDRLRERTGHPLEQDVEVVREEMANELLQDVRIVDRQVDTVAGTCMSTAVMPNSRKLSEAAEKGQTPPKVERR